MSDRIEGELLEKVKAHLIQKLREKSGTSEAINCQDAEEVISAFDGVPTPPENPPGSGTR